jgi:hypothetical protein
MGVEWARFKMLLAWLYHEERKGKNTLSWPLRPPPSRPLTQQESKVFLLSVCNRSFADAFFG